VTFAGWNGASGRMIRIRHKNAYETMYLHLRSFGPGIRSGARVKSGDIMGYVGSSGDSTGPHLDYRITRNGSHLNPLSAKFDPVEPLREEHLDDFKQAIEKYRFLLSEPLAFIGAGFF
jgi:murein DD-endopeptidase MepM/ murein hydrolase activator NlpD